MSAAARSLAALGLALGLACGVKAPPRPPSPAALDGAAAPAAPARRFGG